MNCGPWYRIKSPGDFTLRRTRTTVPRIGSHMDSSTPPPLTSDVKAVDQIG